MALVGAMAILAVGAQSASADASGQVGGSSSGITMQVGVSQPGVRSVLVTDYASSGDGNVRGSDWGDDLDCDIQGVRISVPAGECQLSPILVTNGGAPSQIDVSATDFQDHRIFDQGAPAADQISTELDVDHPAADDDTGDIVAWTMCSMGDEGAAHAAAGAPDCSGDDDPGTDQVWLRTIGTGPDNTDAASLGPEPGCDYALAGPVGGGSCDLDADAQASETLDVTAPSATTDDATSFDDVVTWTAIPQ
jgi:hypothetical protein